MSGKCQAYKIAKIKNAWQSWNNNARNFATLNYAMAKFVIIIYFMLK